MRERQLIKLEILDKDIRHTCFIRLSTSQASAPVLYSRSECLLVALEEQGNPFWMQYP